MSEQPAADTAVWYLGKAFTAYGLGENPNPVAEFRGEDARASGTAWYERTRLQADINACYLYEVRGDKQEIILSWSDTYDGADAGEDDEDDDFDDYLDEWS